MRNQRLCAFELWTNGRTATAHPRVRLICFPHAGGGASRFSSWVNGLGHVADVWPIQLPGREGRWAEPALQDMGALVAAGMDALGPLFDRPVALFGHSMGGLIAFALACELERCRRDVTCVIVSAVRAPHVPDPDPIHGHSSDDTVLTKVREFSGIPDEVLHHGELLQMLLPTLRADLAMCAGYRVGTDRKIACPIVALGGVDDANVPYAHLAAWSHHTTSRFALHRFIGSHFFIFEHDQQVQCTIANELVQCASSAAV